MGFVCIVENSLGLLGPSFVLQDFKLMGGLLSGLLRGNTGKIQGDFVRHKDMICVRSRDRCVLEGKQKEREMVGYET